LRLPQAGPFNCMMYRHGFPGPISAWPACAIYPAAPLPDARKTRLIPFLPDVPAAKQRAGSVSDGEAFAHASGSLPVKLTTAARRQSVGSAHGTLQKSRADSGFGAGRAGMARGIFDPARLLL
jgi:hypothetical protein